MSISKIMTIITFSAIPWNNRVWKELPWKQQSPEIVESEKDMTADEY